MLAVEIAKGKKDEKGNWIPGIKEREKKMGYKVEPGAADSSIFDSDQGMSIGDDMAAAGVSWLHADKSPGSRKIGWEKIRQRLKAATETPMESPGLFIFDHCTQWIRTVPTLPRDKKKRDDVDTNAEDHAGDATRYRLMTDGRPKAKVTPFRI